MLVSAFAGRASIAYRTAVAEEYRFYSYAMRCLFVKTNSN
jgi:S-adenosylmethionine:tRNA-ribosyltransferase-isomerase (queuine synthetase)